MRARQCLLGTACVLLLAVALTSFFSWDRAIPDVNAYWQAAVRLRAGEPVYVTPPPSPSPKAYLYPPAFAAFFAPLTLLTPLWGYAVWQALHAVFLIWCVRTAALLGGVGDPSRRPDWLLACLAVTFPALVGELQEGQANLLAMALALQGVLWTERARPLAGGLALAAAAHVKLYPLALATLLVVWRRSRALAAFGVSLVALAATPMLWRVASGPDAAAGYTATTYAEFIRRILSPGVSDRVVAGDVQFYVLNNSFAAVLHRLFSDTPFSPFPSLASWHGPLLASVPRPILIGFATVGGVLLIGAALWYAARHARTSRTRLLSVGLLYFGVQLTAPTCWEHHLVWLLAVVTPLWVHARDDRLATLRLRAILAVWLAVITLPLVAQLTLQATGTPTLVAWLGASRAWGVPTLAVLLLLAEGMRSVRDERAEQGSSAASSALPPERPA